MLSTSKSTQILAFRIDKFKSTSWVFHTLLTKRMKWIVDQQKLSNRLINPWIKQYVSSLSSNVCYSRFPNRSFLLSSLSSSSRCECLSLRHYISDANKKICCFDSSSTISLGNPPKFPFRLKYLKKIK